LDDAMTDDRSAEIAYERRQRIASMIVEAITERAE
jgi:hypothetical protein